MFTAGEDSRAPTKNVIEISSKEAQTAAAGLGCCSGEDGCRHKAYFAVDQMEFWGTEVAPGKPQVNEPGDDTYVHVSQVALGPGKDGKSERVVIRVESGGKNVVLGTLSSGKVDQMTLDLIFDREFKLSHTSTSSSVFFCGYRTDKQQEYDDGSEEDEEEDEEDEEDDDPVPTAVVIKENGTVSAKVDSKVTRKQLKVVEKLETKPKKGDTLKSSLIDQEADEGEESDEDDDEDDGEEAGKAITMDFGSDDYDEEDDSEFEVGEGGLDITSDDDEDDDEDDSDEEGSDEDGEDDVSAELGKKRTLQASAKKSPGDKKKPRLDTPARPGLITTPGKKGAKGAADTKSTPVPTKKETKEGKGIVAKTPQKTPGKETTVKTPKTATLATQGAGESAKKLGEYFCGECKKNFASDSALSQHASAKHKK